MLEVCNHLDLRSIDALRQTCTHFRKMEPLETIGSTRLQTVLQHTFGGGYRLIEEFNSLLHASGGIVGGSTALYVMCPGNRKWFPADMDIVVRTTHQDVMEAFLQEKVGLVLNEERTQDAEFFYPGGMSESYSDLDNRITFTYRRFDNRIDGQPGVDLCLILPGSFGGPADFVLTYHSTVVMNFWTGRNIHCLWPELTVRGEFIRNKYTPTPKIETALEKYKYVLVFFAIHTQWCSF